MTKGSPVTLEPLSEGKYRLALRLQGRELTLSQRELNSIVLQGLGYVPVVEEAKPAEDNPADAPEYVLPVPKGIVHNLNVEV